ncbi:hypothetical protein KEJ23_00350 [Candidatus Bathyarchaeota archaeon]|nr:hypothetical protein [Candidatus Bathyarchaeota archaeon]
MEDMFRGFVDEIIKGSFAYSRSSVQNDLYSNGGRSDAAKKDPLKCLLELKEEIRFSQ